VPVRERAGLIAAREALGLNRPQLARKMGRSRSYVFRVETGVIDPGLMTISAWLKALGAGGSIMLFEPHPRLRQWSELVAPEIRKAIAQDYAAA
jgi:transcriptional regulator with XRE-family HTH domain